MSSELSKLNIKDLTRDDIIEILNLPVDFTESDFNKQVNKYKLTLNAQNNISDDVKMKIIDLFISAKKMLFYQKNQVVNMEQNNENYKDNNVYENQTKKSIFTSVLNIDTRFRSNYLITSSTDFMIDLPMQLTKVISMKLCNIELPKMIYNISSNLMNNYFMIESKKNNMKLMIIIPDGLYDEISLMNYINNYLVLQNIYPWNNIKCFIDLNNVDGKLSNGTGKMLFVLIDESIKTSFELNFKTNINGTLDKSVLLNMKIGWMMGYREGYYEGNEIYESESSVDLSGMKYMYLVVEDYNNNYNDCFVSLLNSSILKKNIISRISLKEKERKDDIIRSYMSPVNIQRLRIQLLDEYGRLIDLHGLDYSFSLVLGVAQS